MPTRSSHLFLCRIIPDFEREEVFPGALLGVLKQCAQDYEKLLVIPCSDYYTGLLCRHYDHFEGLIANRFISEALLETFDTKDKFYALCEQYGVVAKAALAQKALPQCNIVFETGDEMKTDLETYFKVLYAADPASVGGALPADDFYYAG